ncbi:MAG: AAA family ATPase, partial [Euryarchaeota archaeon]|nr:AAA family ATPase [Euryarchaeota archaeon]
SFDDLRLDVELQDTRDRLLKNIRAFSLEEKLAVGKEGNALLNAIKEPGESTLHFYTTESGVPEKFPLRVIKSFVAARVFMVIHRALYPDVYFFPTERSALTNFIRSVDVEQKIGRDDMHKKEPGGVPLAGPIGALIDETIGVYLKCNSAYRLEEAKKDDEIRDILKLAELSQKTILGGTLDISKSEPELPRELLFELSGDGEVTLDMPVVSSMVKGLSSFVLYLRYIAKPRDILVIDEPEMNLHPEAQVQLTEFLAMLVNAGLNVLITTHSPYIVDHLVNLMKAATCEDQESIKDKFYLGRTDAFIPQDKVSVYLFEDNTAKNILDEKGFIDWDTFSRVSERISHIYFEI